MQHIDKRTAKWVNAEVKNLCSFIIKIIGTLSIIVM